MKYLIAIVLIVSSLWSAELNWGNNYDKALLEASEQNKLVYIFITSDACKWCKKFEATTLQDKGIDARLHKEFVTVHLSRDRDNIPTKFETAPVPRHYFTDAKGNILYSSLGHRQVECFDSFMDNAQNKLKVSK